MPNKTFHGTPIQLADNGEADITFVQLMRTGKFDDFEISPETFKSFVKNFKENVRRVDLAIDYSHRAYDEAAGWIKDVQMSEDEKELWVKVEWTPEAEEKIKAKQFRYLSAEFHLNYFDEEAGKAFGPTLFGGGLTNRPFLKGMKAILSEEEENEFDQIKMRVMDLSDDERAQLLQALAKSLPNFDTNPSTSTKKETQMSEQDKDLAVKLAETEAKLAESEKKNKELSEAQNKMKQESEFNVLLSEGKAVEAQREAFMAGDMAEFAKLSKPLNLSEQGTGEGAGEEKQKTDDRDAETKIHELAEAKQKEDKNLTFADAVSMVLSENPKLNEAYEAQI